MDYEPLDLSSYCNAGVAAYRPHAPGAEAMWTGQAADAPPLGRQTFHGLPFQIGPAEPDDSRCFLAFGAAADLYSQPATVPVHARAHNLIFLHVLLETVLWQGGEVGREVATLTVRYADGEALAVPIRERFEVGNVPLPWGQYPFLAVADRKDQLIDRYEGRWERAGWRHTEAEQGWPAAYYLWVWRNPRPEQPIASITLVPGQPRYIVAGITLGHRDESPLPREVRRPVKITLLDEAAAAKPFALAVTVDRGVATYPYPLPNLSNHADLTNLVGDEASGLPGFGAPFNATSSPAYSEIAAVPSAKVTVNQDEIPLASFTWEELQSNAAVERDRVRIEFVDGEKNWVRVTVEDEDTGRPLPSRVAFHSAAGIPYAPHGHHAPLFSNLSTWNNTLGGDVRLGQITYAYIDGRCEGWLPRGRVLVEVARGYEYEPLRRWVTIEPGQQTLTLRLKRWIDMQQEGYYSGDTHVHFLSAQGSLTEAAGEDLAVVNLLQSQWGHYFSDVAEFTGRPLVSADGGTVVHVSQENRQHMLGHLSLLGLKRPVMPFGSGGPSEAELGGGVETTLSHWADACRAQGGTVVIPHLPTPNGEPAALVATGRADAVEMLEHHRYEHLEYYRYLNAGYRLPLVAGTDKMSANTPVGLYRTYVYIPPDRPFSYENWLEGMRSGRTFISGGALLWLSVEGQAAGKHLRVTGGGTVEIEARARSIFPLHTLQIVQNGRVVAETTAAEGAKQLSLNTHLRLTTDCWLAARCAGPEYRSTPHFDQRRRGIMAHTSPVYVQCGDAYAVSDAGALNYMMTLVDGSLAFLRQTTGHQRPSAVTHHHGRDDHLAYLEEPLQEARRALHDRLHALGIPH